MPDYFIIGLTLGLMSLLDDGIETAMGVHAANNIFDSLFITSKNSALQTPALLTSLNDAPAPLETFILSAILVAVRREAGVRQPRQTTRPAAVLRCLV